MIDSAFIEKYKKYYFFKDSLQEFVNYIKKIGFIQHQEYEVDIDINFGKYCLTHNECEYTIIIHYGDELLFSLHKINSKEPNHNITYREDIERKNKDEKFQIIRNFIKRELKEKVRIAVIKDLIRERK